MPASNPPKKPRRAAVTRRGEFEAKFSDKTVVKFYCGIGQLEEISEHNEDLVPFVGKLAAQNGTLEDVRVVIRATHGEPDELIEKYGLVLMSQVAGLALGAGVGLDEEDTDGAGKKLMDPPA